MPNTRKRRKPKLRTEICKPCWELHYCPYGPLVEHFPLSPNQRSLRSVRTTYQEVLGSFARGESKTEEDVLSAIDHLEYHYPPRWKFLQQFDSEELECAVYGHVCPVFLTASGATETKKFRRHSRHIPQDLILKVARRDGQICQICHQPVPDDQVQLDHIIPHSRGGPLTADNLRLVHKACNRKKSDSLSEVLGR